MAMSEQPQPVAGAAASTTKARTSFGILGAISLSHLLNDMIQSLILAIYPLLQSEFSLTFMQIGMITLTFQHAEDKGEHKAANNGGDKRGGVMHSVSFSWWLLSIFGRENQNYR